MQVSKLEDLAARLQRLQQRLATAPATPERTLSPNDSMVQAARECEFMLPKPLTLSALAATVERKIANVAVLLERARRHEDMPPAAQLAADQEDLATEEDYLQPSRAADGGGAHAAN